VGNGREYPPLCALSGEAAPQRANLIGEGRRIYEDELSAIQEALAAGAYDHADALASYLDAALATGLRPIEWMRIRFVLNAEFAVLVVRNAKFGEGRAHGKFRRLVWRLPDHAREVEAVSRYISIVRVRLAGVPASDRRGAMANSMSRSTTRCGASRRISGKIDRPGSFCTRPTRILVASQGVFGAG